MNLNIRIIAVNPCEKCLIYEEESMFDNSRYEITVKDGIMVYSCCENPVTSDIEIVIFD